MLRDIGISGLLATALLMMSGCREVPTAMNVATGPSFTFSETGRLASFRVYGPQPSRKIATPFDSASLIWRIQPTEGYLKGAAVKGLHIPYGVVPRGYVQTVPVSGGPPAMP